MFFPMSRPIVVTEVMDSSLIDRSFVIAGDQAITRPGQGPPTTSKLMGWMPPPDGIKCATLVMLHDQP
jgi:hypothetical protein